MEAQSKQQTLDEEEQSFTGEASRMAACGSKKAKFPSATCITNLNDDCLSAILNRIACKSVFVYKSVCKRWFDLISKPDFVSGFIAHQTRDNHQQAELLFGSFGVHKNLTPQPDYLQPSLSFLPCFDHEKPDNVQIVGYCNDLCLCFDVDKLICYICNPFTKQFAALPPLPRRPLLAGFICDPYYGSGGINSELKFEVVAVLEYGQLLNSPMIKKTFRGKLFSSKGRDWTNISTSFVMDVILNESSLISPAVPYQNSMYWLAKNGICIYAGYRHRRKHFGFIPNKTTWMYLGLCHDSLRMCKIYRTWLIIQQIYSDRNSSNIKVDLRNMNMPLDVRDRSITTGLREKFIGKMIAISPNDLDIIYLNIDNSFVVSCNLRTCTWNRYDCDKFNPGVHNVVVLSVPYWPTPVPSFPSHI